VGAGWGAEEKGESVLALGTGTEGSLWDREG
jgi:hypothetical protein